MVGDSERREGTVSRGGNIFPRPSGLLPSENTLYLESWEVELAQNEAAISSTTSIVTPIIQGHSSHETFQLVLILYC